MALAKVHGVSVSWGVDSTIVGVNGAFQSREHTYKVDNRSIMNGGDTTVSKVYYDPIELANFTYVAIQLINGFPNARVDIPFIGEWVRVVDNVYGAINGYWLCENITVSSSNTSATRVTLSLARYPFVAR